MIAWRDMLAGGLLALVYRLLDCVDCLLGWVAVLSEDERG